MKTKERVVSLLEQQKSMINSMLRGMELKAYTPQEFVQKLKTLEQINVEVNKLINLEK